MKITNTIDLHGNLLALLDATIDNNETVIINRDSGGTAVLISLVEYNAMKEKLYRLSKEGKDSI